METAALALRVSLLHCGVRRLTSSCLLLLSASPLVRLPLLRLVVTVAASDFHSRRLVSRSACTRVPSHSRQLAGPRRSSTFTREVRAYPCATGAEDDVTPGLSP